MSTRCSINFGYGSRTGDGFHIVAKIYRHSDGYPEGVLPDLARFFDAVQAQTTDTRFNDPCYLAAKFVVWQALENANKSAGRDPLDFLGVGIYDMDGGDIEYAYDVSCFDDDGKEPAISFREL